MTYKDDFQTNPCSVCGASPGVACVHDDYAPAASPTRIRAAHTNVAAAIQEIDAALFSGDTFEEPTARAELAAYLERWTKQLADSTEPEESCSQCGAVVLGYHSCEGVP